MAHESQRQAQILRFWRALELFVAQPVEPVDEQRQVYRVEAGRPLPWQERRPPRGWDAGKGRGRRAGKDAVWRHTVYAGIYQLDRVHTVLEKVFGSSGEDFDGRTPRGESALCALVVTEDGRPLLDSMLVSTAPWAVGRALDPGPDRSDWLDGFETTAGQLIAKVRAAFAADKDDNDAAELRRRGIDVGRPLETGDLTGMVQLAAGLLGVADSLEPGEVRVHSVLVSRAKAMEAQSDFLNSFYVEDLQRVADRVAAGNGGPAITAYLADDRDLGAEARTDLRRQLAFVRDRVAPQRAPAGRWPASVDHPLALSQQFAVNEIMDRLSGQGGVFGVNGPPGTGKTTMLRELVAALVVERARRLAELDRPSAGFGRVYTWRTEEFASRVAELAPPLTGFEIVVASTNNGAVENVTREIPQLGAIDAGWLGQADYFATHASRVLGTPAWGLVAAMLGNLSNRHEFVSRFWFGDSLGQAAPQGGTGPAPGDGPGTAHAEPEQRGFRHELWQMSVGEKPDWSDAVAAFRAALDAEKKARDERTVVDAAVLALPGLQAERDTAERVLATAHRHHEQAQAAAQAAVATAAQAKLAVEYAVGQRVAHRQFKPGLLDALFTLGRAVRRWNSADGDLADRVSIAERVAQDAHEAAHHAGQAATRAGQQLAAAQARHDLAKQRLAAADGTVAEASQRWGGTVPGAWWWTDEPRRELAGPWLDPEWNRLRTEVFLAALRLHVAFIAANARTVGGNLRVLMDLLRGNVPAEVPPAAIQAAWQSLFLVIPVVSTTFASTSRLFARLGQEALGWLFIDEAGQATPQAAAGAIWRARRVVAVGDPLQLEPVFSVMFTTQQALRRHLNVAETWLPARTSAQALADRRTPVGTWLPGSDTEAVWVGVPLRVHRRCDQPMFGLVNNIAYDGLMIQATVPRSHPLTVAPSAWFDVVATVADGHWLPEEGEAARGLVDYLLMHGVAGADILAISPFRHASTGLSRVMRRYDKLLAGTVHVAQGKERDIVLLVLGGNPNRPGARAWAARRPNLVNVAVSRARQRLYVIGNRDAWAAQPYFDQLAGTLPVESEIPR